MSVTAVDNWVYREASTESIDALRRHAEPLPPPECVDEFGAFFKSLWRCARRSARRVNPRHVRILSRAGGDHTPADCASRLQYRGGRSRLADAARIDEYVRHQAPRPGRGDVFVRFPPWMLRNVEVLEFTDWLRSHIDLRTMRPGKIKCQGCSGSDACCRLTAPTDSTLSGHAKDGEQDRAERSF